MKLRATKQYGKKTILSSSQDLFSPAFIERENEITIFPQALYYPESGNIYFGTHSIHLVEDMGSLQIYMQGGVKMIHSVETQCKFYLKFFQDLEKTDVYSSENKIEYLVEILKKNGFDQLYPMMSGCKSEKHHIDKTRYFVRDHNGNMKYHFWVKNEDELIQKIKDNKLDPDELNWHVNMQYQ